MSENKIKVKINQNASAKIEADIIEVELADGTIVTKEKMAFICRCSKSANQPFCDGTHKTCGFEG